MSLEAFYRLSPNEQAIQLEADAIADAKCHECGRPRTECGDGSTNWSAHRIICYPTMVLAAANRAYDKSFGDDEYHDGSFTHFSKEPTKYAPYHVRDGVTIYVSDTLPTDGFLPDFNEPEVASGDQARASHPRVGDELSDEGGGGGGSDPAAE